MLLSLLEPGRQCNSPRARLRCRPSGFVRALLPFRRSWTLGTLNSSASQPIPLTFSLVKPKRKRVVQTSSFYSEWRLRSGAVSLLRDDHDSPPESLLQAIWLNQRIRRQDLATLDGRPVKILHPGFPSVEGGPDFRSAVVQFGSDLPVAGDVEVDVRASGWHAHGHDTNAAFRSVILHVVWQAEAPVGPPVLALRPVIDSSLGQLSLWLGARAPLDLPDQFRGKCCDPLRQLPRENLRDLLQQAAHVRLQSKAAQVLARSVQVGWEQALWEGLFHALGYKHNSWPMQRLAELRPQWLTPGSDPRQLQARLLGLAGLLPAELPRGESGQHVRALWDIWWRERNSFEEHLLPRNVWRMHGLRPANNPVRRLALAALWARENVAEKVKDWGAGLVKARSATSASRAAALLLPVLTPDPDPFWSWHLTLNSARLAKQQPLIGAARATDLAINVVLPWLWARENKNSAARQRIETCYMEWPAAEDNAVLRLGRQRLLGGAHRGVFGTAALQQGLIQVTRDFCDRSTATCDGCALPSMIGVMKS